METIVVPAEIHEAGEILKLQYLCYRSEAAIYDDYSIPPLTQTLESMREDFALYQILVAKNESGIVGSVRSRTTSTTCHIGRLMVHPRLRRKGLGTNLMLRVEEEFSDALRYELFTGHRSDGNLSLYGHLGYREFKRDVISATITLVYLEKFRGDSVRLGYTG